MIGKLIIFSGIDGSGKTTQIELLSQHFKSLDLSFKVLKQPSNWYRNLEVVRKYLDSGKNDCSVETIALLSAADRQLQLDKEIKPLLSKGVNVICDRYVYSALGYFNERGVDISFVKEINRYVPIPDYGIVMSIDANIACKRLKMRDGDNLKFEEKDPTYLNNVQSTMMDHYPNNFLILDANQSIKDCHSKIKEYLFDKA